MMPYCPACKDELRGCFECPPCARCGRVAKFGPNPGDLETAEVFCSPECAAAFTMTQCESTGQAMLDTSWLLTPGMSITDRESREFITRTLARLCEMELKTLSDE